MRLKVEIPDDPIVRLLYDLNRQFRPEWERKVLRWFSNNNIELVSYDSSHP
ncbi:MAG: hypothetical protein H5T34_04255 [Candidatus Methanomethyliales bacterium]|nr:hypothetical protein [Candidatus Methanomethylicales archaeon]